MSSSAAGASAEQSFTEIVGAAMRRLRERQGLSQGQVAYRAPQFLNRATVNRMELGQVKSTDKTITLCLQAMGLTMLDLRREIGDTRVKRQGRRQVSRSEPIQPPLANVV